jgi:hypothetical protein
MEVNAYMLAKEAGLGYQLHCINDEEGSLLGLTREGVRGYC